MVDTMIPKQVDETSFNRMLVAAVVMALLGGCLGFLCLACQSPTAFKDQAQRSAHNARFQAAAVGLPFEAYYLKGELDSSQNWQQKRLQVLAATNQPVELSHAELNAWLRAHFRPVADTASPQTFEMRAPNIYLSQQIVYISVPFDFSILGLRKQWILFARGSFVGEEKPQFKFDSLYLNNAALPFAAGYGGSLVSGLLSVFSGAQDYQLLVETWQRIESIQLSANAMQLHLR